MAVQSSEPVASVLPSGENASEVTALVCRAKVARSLPVATSQTMADESRLPEARDFPSGAKARQVIAPSWPFNARVARPW